MCPNPEQVHGCILVSPEGRYLLVQGRASGKWSFPKGHPLPDEPSLVCAQRELFEETGITAPFMFSKTLYLATGIYYLYNIRDEVFSETQDSDEVLQTNWFTANELRRMSVNVDVNTFLRRTKKNYMKTWRRSGF
jgi:8-oxo-dGTP pyrophosphatase MutT (NUDIX family)